MSATSLPELLEHWVENDPRLIHFHIKRLSWTWLICDCIDHAWADHPQFRVRTDRVEVYGPFSIHGILLAGDPQFLPKLRQELTKVCKYGSDPLDI